VLESVKECRSLLVKKTIILWLHVKDDTIACTPYNLFPYLVLKLEEKVVVVLQPTNPYNLQAGELKLKLMLNEY